MHAVLFYFSGTGNTWWTSFKLKEELESLGHSVEMYSLENPLLEENGFVQEKIKDSDHIIIAYPVYGSELPKNMRAFVRDLPETEKNKKFSVLCTQAAFSGDANIYFKRDVEEKGYDFLQSFQINFTTNFNVAMFPFAFSKPAQGEKLERKKRKIEKKLKRMAEKIGSGNKYLEGRRFYQILLGGLQRFFFRRGEDKLPQKFKFFSDRCIKCNLCVNSCPAKCIVLDDSNGGALEMKRQGDCLLCFRCYNFCPKNAINYGGKIKDPDKYIRYKGPVKDFKLSEIRK